MPAFCMGGGGGATIDTLQLCFIILRAKKKIHAQYDSLYAPGRAPGRPCQGLRGTLTHSEIIRVDEKELPKT